MLTRVQAGREKRGALAESLASQKAAILSKFEGEKEKHSELVWESFKGLLEAAASPDRLHYLSDPGVVLAPPCGNLGTNFASFLHLKKQKQDRLKGEVAMAQRRSGPGKLEVEDAGEELIPLFGKTPLSFPTLVSEDFENLRKLFMWDFSPEQRDLFL